MINKINPETNCYDMYLSSISKIPNATLNLPGSKSIANRVLLLAAVANGESIIHNVPDVAEDVVLMLDALKALGVEITHVDSAKFDTDISINQSGGTSSYKIIGSNGRFPNQNASIFCGNSGTSIRFLTAMLAFMQGNYELTGIERMKERPINDLVFALVQVGADIIYAENEGFPPLLIKPFYDNQAPVIKISGKISSQYLTGVLMALPLLKRKICIQIIDELISKPYIDITRALLEKFGGLVAVDRNNYTINSNTNLAGIEYTIEPDASSASYFLAMGAIAGNITVNNLSKTSLQGDKDFAKVLAQMGADVKYLEDAIQISPGKLMAVDINMESMPDVAMTIAVLALFAEGTTTIRGIKSWKVKETDRLQAMYNELTKLGAIVAITNDSISIVPPLRITHDVAIETYNDHRMAMCFSLLAVYGVPVIITDYKCVGKTFANYFDIFKQLCY